MGFSMRPLQDKNVFGAVDGDGEGVVEVLVSLVVEQVAMEEVVVLAAVGAAV
jgi:hypothetical protein